MTEAKCSNTKVMQETLSVHLILISFYFFQAGLSSAGPGSVLGPTPDLLRQTNQP